MVTGLTLPDGNGVLPAAATAQRETGRQFRPSSLLRRGSDPTTATSLDSYSVFCNGVDVAGGIKAVYYTGPRHGLQSQQRAEEPVRNHHRRRRTNIKSCWLFNSALINGIYQIVVKNTVATRPATR